MNGPVVSVIIPTYKRPALLEQAITSVLAQTYTDWELIVVDDNDEDTSYREDTERFMTRYRGEPRIRYAKHRRNSGLPAARNTGIREAAGRYVAFLDDDDRWLPTKLEKQVACFGRSNDKVALVYTGLNIVDAKGDTLRLRWPKVRGAALSTLLTHNAISTPSSVMCKKDAVHDIGLFDEALPSAEDWDFYIRLTLKYEVDYVDELLTLYTKHEGEQMMKNVGILAKAYDLLYAKHKPVLEKNRKLHGMFLLRQGGMLKTAGDLRNAERWLVQSLRIYPLSQRALKEWLKLRLGRGSYEAIRRTVRPLAALRNGRPKHE